MDVSGYLTDVPDFPVPGIIFKDISPLLADTLAFRAAVEQMAEPFRDRDITSVAGIDSRGFLFGPSIAQVLGSGFVMIRKAGKLPGTTVGVDYNLEYGSDRLEILEGALGTSDRTLIVDDVLATGGSLRAAVELVGTSGATVEGISVLVELLALNGRANLPVELVHAEIEVN